ncbi:hypothetical protein B617_gp49 [Nonlabens phage P12024S]|uniref:Uncharacterized protein n=1 Tax=Nonlabens phage P12024S TaxID=1168478 RepID=I6S6P8_9CAUD|nr:hypothetical protein B617_gp49 [Nonlabens phage P12024S]AFM54710.1 hypothetical protein P12024S_49 [Nonlabens phage P12024S]
MAIEKEIKIKVDTSQAEAGVKKINKGLQKTEKESKKVGDSSKAAFGKLDSLTGGAISKVKGFTSSLSGVATGFKSIGAAIALSGIGLILITIAALTAAFKNSEAGQNKFAKLMGVIGSVTGNVVDVIAKVGEFIIDVFSGDSGALKSLKDFGSQIFDIIGLPIKNAIDIVKALGRAFQALGSGDISGAFDELKSGVSDVKENLQEAKSAATDFYDTAIQGSKEFVKQLQEEAKIAANIADQRAKADKLDRDLIVQRAESNRKIAELREKAARRDLFTDAQRKQFLIEASELNEKITKQEIESARLRRDAIVEENKLSGSGKEDLKAEEEAKARLIELETKRIQTQRRLSTEISTINTAAAAQATAAVKKQEQDAAKSEEIERKRLESISKAREKFQDNLENIEADTEEKKLELEKQRAQEELDRLIGTETEKQEAQLALDDLFDKKREELREKRELEEQVRIDKIAELGKLEVEIAREKAAELRDQRIAEIEELVEDEEEKFRLLEIVNRKYKEKILDIDEKASEKQKDYDRIVAENKKALIIDGLAIVQSELKRGSAVSKGIAAAQTIFDTQQGITSALAAKGADQLLPFPVRLANAALVGIKGALALKNILKTNPISAAGGTAQNNAGAAGTQAPAFNLTASSGVNQIAGDVQGSQPLRAFVVGSDVTNQQQMDRDTFGQAGLG